MSEFKKCPDGHYYIGDSCPCCLPQRKVDDSYIFGRRPDSETTIIPVCKHCGHRIRKSIPDSITQQYNNMVSPWNHEWDGKCEFCGHDYSIYMGTPVLFGQKKKTSVTADSKMIGDPDNLDQYRVLSGVTIKTTVGDEAMGDSAYGEVFLSANELKGLIDILKDSPLLEQFDYDFCTYM